MGHSNASLASQHTPKKAPARGDAAAAGRDHDQPAALTPGAVVQAAQNPAQLSHRELLYIQRTVGNRALGRVLHGAPKGQAAARKEREPSALDAAAAGLDVPTVGMGPLGLAAAKAASFARAHGPTVQRTTANGVTVNGMRFVPAELPADGATTSQASVNRSGRTTGTAKVDWSIVGPAFGTTIDANGLITPGNAITPGADKVRIKIKAADNAQPGAHTFGFLTLWDTKFLQAKADFPVFRALNLTKDPVTVPFPGKFAMAYHPAARRLDATLRVKFKFLNNKAGAAKWNAKSRQAFEQKFISTVQGRWSNQYRFVNVREPQSIWKKLNPVTVRVRVTKDDKTPHQTITVHKKAITAAVGVGGVTGQAQFTAGDVTPNVGNFPNTGAGEQTALAAVTPTPIAFPAGSAALPAADKTKLQFMAIYLRRIKVPRFNVRITGHHQKVVHAPAATGAQKKAANQQARRLANERAEAVFKILQEGRATANHHVLKIGVGDAGAAPVAAWDRVDITSAVPAGFKNVQTTLEHEAGHMFGLDDEYVYGTHAVGDQTDHYALTMQAFGKNYADVQAKMVADSASLMNGGNDIRPHHYVTFWDGLSQMTQTAAVPVPPFGQADWKFEGET